MSVQSVLSQDSHSVSIYPRHLAEPLAPQTLQKLRGLLEKYRPAVLKVFLNASYRMDQSTRRALGEMRALVTQAGVEFKLFEL